MTAYSRLFLEENGYLERHGTDTVSVDGRSIQFAFDPDARLAYFEDIEPDFQQTVVQELQFLGRNFDFYWFWNPEAERLAVYNRYGEHKWFIYNQSIGHAADVRDSKQNALAGIDEGLETLFDIRSVVDQFYRNLWDIRLDIARALDTPGGTAISDEARLMAAQRTIDRLIFCYFLIKKDIIHGVDDAGNRFGLAPKKMFTQVLANGDFYTFLTEMFFDHLNTEGWTEFEVTDTVAITYPYLNGGLFRNHQITTDDGTEIYERELDGASYDWATLVDELNRYNWLVEESPTTQSDPDEQAQDTPYTLSPAVLGHIFEKFVITVSELSDDEALTLQELDEMDISASGEQLLEGNRQVGAYYTPNYIAYENTRETLWNRVRHALADSHDLDPDAIPSADAFFEQLHDDESAPVEPADVEAILANLSVIDPAAGSGAFLMTAGEILEEWRRRCLDDHSRYDLRRDIIRQSLYGVDLLDGAVEVCKLRLWLWLISATTVDLDAGRPKIEPLPNIDFNVRQGNSLVGIAQTDYGTLIPHLEFEWIDGEMTTYPEAVEDYRETITEYQTASGSQATELRSQLTEQRQILHAELTQVFAQERDVTVEESVATHEDFTRRMADVAGEVKFNLDFDTPMTDAERQQVADAGFREQQNWATTAYHSDIRKASDDDIEAIFDLMAERGTISIERPLSPRDVDDLDPFHWIFEFPMAYAPTDEPAEAFDVVIGNPPHGSALDALQKAVLEDVYTLIEDSREVAKMFTERSWTLTDGELSYIVPKPSTYNSNWEDFRTLCLPKMHRGVDLGKAFRNVDHEQVTVHLSRVATGEDYLCGPLAEGSYHLDDSARVAQSFAETLGTLPVSFTAREQTVAAGLDRTGFPTLGEIGADAGRGARTTLRISDSDAPIAYNGKQVQRYFTRAAEAHIETDNLSGATKSRVDASKVMAQNIIAHKTTPYDHIIIAAVYDPVASYNFETVTNILLPDDAALSLPALAVLLNTQFVNWFIYMSIFNRAIRDMHLDAYFLDNLVVPKRLSETEQSLLADLYELLAITGVATEYDALPPATDAYTELQSIANAVTYELYLRDVDDQPVETDLVSRVAASLDGYDIAFEDWYTDHLACASEQEVVETFETGTQLFKTALDVVDSLQRQTITAELRAIADHDWVEIIERGQHRRDGRPVFGPVTEQ